MSKSIFKPIKMNTSPLLKVRGRAAKAASSRMGFTRSFQVDFVLRDWYFDRPAIERALRRARMNKKNLMRMAGQVRTIAKRSIRKRKWMSKTPKKASPPGTPPRSRYPGHPMRLIGFGLNPTYGTVLVGAEFLRRRYRTTVPSVHEHGKRVRVRYPVYRKPKQPLSPTQKRNYRRLLKKGHVPKPPIVGHTNVGVTYPKRPFMVPAMKKAKSTYPQVWRNSLRRF